MDLKYIAELINPEWFIPIHGFFPENLNINSGIRFVPEERNIIVLENFNLMTPLQIKNL